MTISIYSDKKHPQGYQCGNFNECGVSSSHDPEYVGWIREGSRWYCSDQCALKGALQLLGSRY